MKAHKKTVQIVGLCALLVVVLVGGIWFLNRDGQPQEPTTPSGETNPSAGGETDPSVPTTTVPEQTPSNLEYERIRVQERTEEVDAYRIYPTLYAPFLYQGQACMFSCQQAENQIQLVTAAEGTVLQTYPATEGTEDLEALCLDGQGNLWALLWNAQGEVSLVQWDSGMGQGQKIWDASPEHCFIRGFWLWENYAVIHCVDYEANTQTILRYDMETKQVESGTIQAREGMICLDTEGYLYTMILWVNGNYEMHWELKKCSLVSGEEQWASNDCASIPLEAISCDSEGTLYILADSLTESILYRVDTATGSLLEEKWDLATELDTPVTLYTSLDFMATKFLAVSDDNVTICQVGAKVESAPCSRSVLTLEPYTVVVEPEDIVTLTITAPYPPEEIQGAIQMFQRRHPEVQIEWDTQYLTREEFQADVYNYMDAISVRTMAGDVGDLQMINGSGLSQDVITETDAFADLTPYLEASPIRDELEWNLLEPLRDASGAVRGVPLGVSTRGVLYNVKLLEELGNPIDPETVTWSELLDLALQWKREGKSLSLALAEDRDIIQKDFLYNMLLANLYGEDSLKQPEFRELLEKMKELWGSTQFVGMRRSNFWYEDEGDYSRMLMQGIAVGEDYSQTLSYLGALESEYGLTMQAAPRPWGETYKGQQFYGYCWGIPSGSEKKDLAWSLLEFILSADGTPYGVYAEGFDSINNVVYENRYQATQYAINGPDVSAFHEQLKSLRQLPISRYDEPYGWAQAVYFPILDYMEGKITLDEALESATSNWERYLLG